MVIAFPTHSFILAWQFAITLTLLRQTHVLLGCRGSCVSVVILGVLLIEPFRWLITSM